jgi:hypothetical protein
MVIYGLQEFKRHKNIKDRHAKSWISTFRKVILRISIYGSVILMLIKAGDYIWGPITGMGMIFFWLQVVTLGGFMLGISLMKISYDGCEEEIIVDLSDMSDSKFKLKMFKSK